MAAESDIMAALFGRVASFVASPALPIAWPNVVFTPPANQRYLRVQFVPNVANRLFLGSAEPHQLLGLLQLSVYGSKGSGEATTRALAASVAAHFPADLELSTGGTTVRVTKRAEVRDMLVEDAAIQIPLIVSWEAFA